MPTYAAFLRSINVAGQRVKMDALTEAFTAAGFTDVVTFQATGNVLFSAPRASRSDLERHLEATLGDALGFEVPTYVRTAGELRAVAAHDPFPPGDVASGAGRLQEGCRRALRGETASRPELTMETTTFTTVAFGTSTWV